MFRQLTVIAIIAALAGPTVLAAQGLRARRAVGQRQQRVQRGERVGQVQQRLNLNAAQQEGLRALQQNRRAETQSFQQELRQKRQALREILQQSNPNANDVGNATLQLKEIRERMRGVNQRFLSGLRGLLTPDQLQQLPKRLQ
jgi:Spy/CpxP family protein refolding chaperone